MRSLAHPRITPRARVARLALVSAASWLLLLACTGKDPYNPGTPLGTFHVVGKLQSNSCGGGGTAPDPWEFDIKLARDSGTLYWVQGGPPVQGILDAHMHATLKASATQTVQAAKPGSVTCALTRDDALDATLEPDPAHPSGFTSFSGTLGYTFGQTADSDCSTQLAIDGGGFATLPCSVSYAVSATRTKLPPAAAAP